MSPMGTLVLGTNSKPPQKVSLLMTTNHNSNNSSSSLSSSPTNIISHTHDGDHNSSSITSTNNSSNDHPLLKLMNVSLMNENSLSLNLHQSLALTLGKKSTKMTLLASSTTTTPLNNYISSSSIISKEIRHEENHSNRMLTIGPDSTSSTHEDEQSHSPLQEQNPRRKRFRRNSHDNDNDTEDDELRSEHSNNTCTNSNSPSLESQNSGNCESSERISNNKSDDDDGDGDEDEVLSIGRDDDQSMIIDCDSSTLVSEDYEDDEIIKVRKRVKRDFGSEGHDEPIRSSNSVSPTQNGNLISASILSPSEYQHYYLKDTFKHNANYSSSHTHNRHHHLSLPSPLISNNNSPYLPFSISEAIMMKSHQRQEQNEQQQRSFQQQQASLLFSIANILRPDFGLGGGKEGEKREPSRKSSSGTGHKRSLLPSSTKSGPRNSNTTNNNNGNRKHSSNNPIDPLNPIDLSRPSLVGSNIGNGNGSESHFNHVIHHHRKNSSSNSSNNHKANNNNNNSISSVSTTTTTISNNSSNNHHNRSSHKSSSENNVGGHRQKEQQQQQQQLDKSPGHNNNNHNHYNSSNVKKSHKSSSSTTSTSTTTTKSNNKSIPPITTTNDDNNPWPAWVYCTRYSDRPSSGPRTRRGRTTKKEKEIDEKRPRTAFTSEQLARLKKEFEENRYLTEKRRQDLANELRLHENQIKIWFQNKRAKLKKSTGQRGGLALQLMAQGLYNHSTIPARDGEDDDDYDDSD